MRTQSFDHPAVALSKKVDFSGFLNASQTQAALSVWPAAAYVTTPSGREVCDAYVRIEHLDEDLAPVEAHLGFRLRPLPHENRSDRPADYRAAYSDTDAALVSQCCAKDIVQFGYAF